MLDEDADLNVAIWNTQSVYLWENIIPGADYIMEFTGACVFPNTNILTENNGQAILAIDIQENDNIAYMDFKDNTMKIGKVAEVYIHKNATDFVKYTFEDGSYIEVTDYHPIYTKDGWKSLTGRKGYSVPELGDEVKTENGWNKLAEIEIFTGKEDCYDFSIIAEDGSKVENYFANGVLVESSL